MHKIIHFCLPFILLLSASPVLATVVVFEAGFGQTAQSWGPLLKHLPADYKVITYTPKPNWKNWLIPPQKKLRRRPSSG